MAYGDYRHCDVCDCKVFYDVDVNYERVGAMAVICQECAKTREVRVVELQPEPSTSEEVSR
jgi:hypothetical protein